MVRDSSYWGYKVSQLFENQGKVGRLFGGANGPIAEHSAAVVAGGVPASGWRDACGWRGFCFGVSSLSESSSVFAQKF